MTGWYIGISIGIISLVLLIRGVYEPRKLDVTHTVLGEGQNSVKLLLLSDIHAPYFYVSVEKIGEVIRTANIDAVVFAGDICNGKRDFAKGMDVIRRIKAFSDETGTPFFAVEGNHDPAETGKRLREIGVRFLENSSDSITSRDGSHWQIAGLRDIRNSAPSYAEAVINETSGSNISSAPKVVLAHNPDAVYNVIDDKPEDSPDVFLLSGHFHGGQIWMPFDIEYLIMRKERMCREGLRKEAFEKNGIRGYISRGLGCVIVPLRFLSKPEAAVIELRS